MSSAVANKKKIFLLYSFIVAKSVSNTKPKTNIFFPLFIADIQEFYELTLLDDTKTIQQKTVETLQIASKWEQENSLKISDVSCLLKHSKFVL